MAEHNAIIHEYAWSGNKNELEMNIIEPAMRSGYKNDSKIYLNERTLCGILELDPVKLAAVQLSSLDTRRGRQLRANLVAQMNRSFGSEQATFAFASSYLETPSNERDKFINRTMDILLKKPEVKASRPPVPLWRRLFAS